MATPFEADVATLPAQDRYKLLCGLVVPRPIALVTSIGPGGVVNAAPFSFFNVFAEDPALVVLGLQARSDGSLKDTAAHIRDTGSFVVNLVDEALAERMNICAVDFPAETSELDAAPHYRATQFQCRALPRRSPHWNAATIRRSK
jgi:flavin reductase (DIM6/NTAB) family NADH-FMN oxidoreductase RutF